MPAYNGFPATYQPMYYQPYQQMQYQPQYQQQYQQPMPQQATQQPVQQAPAMQGTFVRVKDENEARTYFVAPGNSVTFINEDSSYLFTKTVEINQLDKPKFEKYRLYKEDDGTMPVQAVSQNHETDLTQYVLKSEYDGLKSEYAALRSELDSLRSDMDTFRGDLYGIAGKKTAIKKKEVIADE